MLSAHPLTQQTGLRRNTRGRGTRLEWKGDYGVCCERRRLKRRERKCRWGEEWQMTEGWLKNNGYRDGESGLSEGRTFVVAEASDNGGGLMRATFRRRDHLNDASLWMSSQLGNYANAEISKKNLNVLLIVELLLFLQPTYQPANPQKNTALLLPVSVVVTLCFSGACDMFFMWATELDRLFLLLALSLSKRCFHVSSTLFLSVSWTAPPAKLTPQHFSSAALLCLCSWLPVSHKRWT